jgi:NAD(P)-dependent dehydrogenase (short-subunit alcohol dehydrogenase family)
MLPHSTLLFPLSSGALLVTGAASGIGLATVRLAVASGLPVIALDRDVAALGRVTGEFPSVVPQAFDLGDTGAIPAMAASLARDHGPIRYLVNNAGSWAGGRLCELTDATWRQNFSINLEAPLSLLRALSPAMRDGGGGAVVNVTSRNALRSSVGLAAYDASKAALNALTRTAAGELAAWNIRVNSLMPGVIATPGEADTQDAVFSKAYQKLIPLGRYGRPEEIASVILFLLSEGASFINGEAILVDGGQMACQDNVRFREILAENR